jgi:hypothetical protein
MFSVAPNAPRREEESEDRGPHPADMLLAPVGDPIKFGGVLSAYLDREKHWKVPRVRFTGNLNKRHHYSVDRLIAAANIFDILPDTAFPPIPPMPTEVEVARDKARALFKALPDSSDRASVLGALGRVGKMSLKRKIGSRVKLISDKCGARFVDLLKITEKAVNCRNYFVHGGDQEFQYADNYPLIWFFVDTLEFVFGASDLIDAGWEVNHWLGEGSTMTHPFGVYKVQYKENLQRFKHMFPDRALPGADPI